MKIMQDYTNYCTEEQTRRAWELGAPFEDCTEKEILGHNYISTTPYLSHTELVEIPTTQQMIGWLREKNIHIEIGQSTGNHYYYLLKHRCEQVCQWNSYNDYAQAELAAIDAAFDYLEKGGTR